MTSCRRAAARCRAQSRWSTPAPRRWWRRCRGTGPGRGRYGATWRLAAAATADGTAGAVDLRASFIGDARRRRTHNPIQKTSSNSLRWEPGRGAARSARGPSAPDQGRPARLSTTQTDMGLRQTACTTTMTPNWAAAGRGSVCRVGQGRACSMAATKPPTRSQAEQCGTPTRSPRRQELESEDEMEWEGSVVGTS